MQARAKVSKTSRRQQRLVFAAIALFMTCAALAPMLLAMLSGRPDLYTVKPKGQSDALPSLRNARPNGARANRS